MLPKYLEQRLLKSNSKTDITSTIFILIIKHNHFFSCNKKIYSVNLNYMKLSLIVILSQFFVIGGGKVEPYKSIARIFFLIF